MNAEILSVGTELLLGDIVNTNAHFLSRELAALGINVYLQTVVGDNKGRLLSAYENAFARADLVIATGGLGPTEDDLTKETAAEYFGLGLELHQESWEKMKRHFSAYAKMPSNNRKQAMMPEGCAILPNNNGTAPGCMIEKNGKALILLPGPPNELIPMFTDSVIPLLKPKADCMLYSRTLKICGVGESQAEIILKDMMEAQTNPTMALYAKTSEVWLRLTARAGGDAEAEEMLRPVAEEVRQRLGQNIYGEDEDTLTGVVIDLIRQKEMTLSIAESCTGGSLTSDFVDNPGVSEVLAEAVVAYSNESKVRRLGVSPDTLAMYGAVSKETAAEMAVGVAASGGARIGVSTTGIAGPGGGTEEKPVGLVYIGVSVDGSVETKECKFTGNRNKIRQRAVITALDMLRRIMLK